MTKRRGLGAVGITLVAFLWPAAFGMVEGSTDAAALPLGEMVLSALFLALLFAVTFAIVYAVQWLRRRKNETGASRSETAQTRVNR